jgi:hypothetical protein
MFWPRIEPSSGHFDWSGPDKLVGDLAAKGIRVLPIMWGSPKWVAPSTITPPLDTQAARRAWQSFLKAAVKRYGPKGKFWRKSFRKDHHDKKPLPITAWEIWNEPNLKNYFRAQPFARPYAALLRAAYPAVKGADPGATVLMASMANFSWRDLAKLLSVPGPRLRFDAAGAHPFSGRPSNALKIVRLNREALDRRGYGRVPLWLTELTWSSAKGKKTPLTQNWETTEVGQANRLREIYRLLLRDRRRLRLARVFWYTWATVDNGSPNSFDYSGLRAELPGGGFRDKPSLGAFRAVVKAARTA